MATSVKRLRKHIFLHPKDKSQKQIAIKSTLLRDKKRYSDKMDGAILDVSDIKLIGDRHLIVDGFLSMEVIAKFHVFSPKPGMELEGVVNKCSKSHLGCLVMDTFNASLSVPRSLTTTPSVGDTCKFKVTEVVVEGEILFVRGVLNSFQAGPDSQQNLQFTEENEDSEEENLAVTHEEENIDDDVLLPTDDSKTL